MSLYSEYFDKQHASKDLENLIQAGQKLNLSDQETIDSAKYGEALHRFIKIDQRFQILMTLLILILGFTNYLFLSQVTGDFFWNFSFFMLFLLPLFLLPFWRVLNLYRIKSVLRIMARAYRRRLILANILIASLALLPGYVFTKEYVRSIYYQGGTCLELTGADENYYYLNPISCFSGDALFQITNSASAAQECEFQNLGLFSTSSGKFCTQFLREPTAEEAEILKDRVAQDGNSF